jgi:6-phosphofructokinase 1
LSPLVKGEDYPAYRDGLPDYVRLRNAPVLRKLPSGFKP